MLIACSIHENWARRMIANTMTVTAVTPTSTESVRAPRSFYSLCENSLSTVQSQQTSCKAKEQCSTKQFLFSASSTRRFDLHYYCLGRLLGMLTNRVSLLVHDAADGREDRFTITRGGSQEIFGVDAIDTHQVEKHIERGSKSPCKMFLQIAGSIFSSST